MVGAGIVRRGGRTDVLAHSPLCSDRVRESILSGPGRDLIARFRRVRGALGRPLNLGDRDLCGGVALVNRGTAKSPEI
jgi:hypothetical protein